MITIYNSYTKQKETFKPLVSGKIGMYVCGMTVYDFCHLGHARAMVAFDVIIRHFKAQGYDVTYVRNITDIDDKIIERALANKESVSELTERMINALHADAKQLNLLPPDIEPRATANIDAIIALIERLMAKGYAYQAESGDVYFEVEKFEHYGRLSNKDLAGQQAGARVEIAQHKKNALDFVLWKPAKAGEPAWPSPWGEGRPGWHIECSAMSMQCLGETFDIHGGGFDLQFPHHENEIAQSEAATDKPFAKHWMHVGFLNVDDEKMSKSLGNFFTIRDVLASYDAEVVRYFLISSHYRSQLNYSTANLAAAKSAVDRLYQTLSGIDLPQNDLLQEDMATWVGRFNAAMNDDFNTPEAIAVLFDLAREVNRKKQQDDAVAIKEAQCLKSLANQLGLLERLPEHYFQGETTNVDEIEQLLADRQQARKEKDWAMADKIRAELLEQGIEILDGPEGSTWRRIG